MPMPPAENMRALHECVLRNMGMPLLGAERADCEALEVLVVEDDAADRYLLDAALAAHPRVSNIVVAKDGVEALELIDNGAVNPDLAIIDLQMPRKNGFALLLELRLRSAATFPSVVLTSSRSKPDAMRSRNRGAELFLVKPHSIEQLAALMADVISLL
jgi:CheY-like chemotaxis protein